VELNVDQRDGHLVYQPHGPRPRAHLTQVEPRGGAKTRVDQGEGCVVRIIASISS
jgi:hypothetical protein